MILLILVVAVLVGPLLAPVPPLEGTRPAEELAGAEGRFVELDGLTVHYKRAGEGEPLIVLLHGFGANASSWNRVMAPLAELGTVVAYDRPAFGLTERPLGDALRNWPGPNPYSAEAQADQLAALIQEMGFERAILVGNSAGGTVAMLTALRHPERVQGIVFVDASIYAGGGPPGWLKPLLSMPQMRRLGSLLARNVGTRGNDMIELAWHDPSRITAEDIAAYRLPTQVEDWDRALWEFTLAGRDLDLAPRVGELDAPALVITGDDDRIVPPENSIRLARELPNADLVMIPECGHVPQEECPAPFLDAVKAFVTEHSK
jgi:pimeloyl-ACP methyl ester carboxylesterase